jgi:hypothetical protein
VAIALALLAALSALALALPNDSVILSLGTADESDETCDDNSELICDSVDSRLSETEETKLDAAESADVMLAFGPVTLFSTDAVPSASVLASLRTCETLSCAMARVRSAVSGTRGLIVACVRVEMDTLRSRLCCGSVGGRVRCHSVVYNLE